MGEVNIERHRPPDVETARACESILRDLPEWFGLEDAIVDYVEGLTTAPTFIARNLDEVVGFASVTLHTEAAAEVIVMAVAPAHHRRGIGARLVDAVEEFSRQRGASLLQVKTLAATHPSPAYAATRRFYESLGFLPLQVFPDLWEPGNPCLQMVKWLDTPRARCEQRATR